MKAGRWVGFAIAFATLAVAAPASALPVTALSAVDQSCTSGERSGAGVAKTRFTMPVAGWVTARLSAASGDWDLAIIDSADGRVVAGSASRGATEVASGLATQGSNLVVQACRRSGSASTANLTTAPTAVDTSHVQKVQLVRVSTPTLARKNELQRLGLDLTEHGGPGFVEAVLYGAADASRLVDNNFAYTVAVPDMAVQARKERAADIKFAAAYPNTELPSGRNVYRRLFDYSEDMKRLAREHPDLVRPITLNNQTYEGRTVEGIEIATNPNARDGRPVFLQMGAHHAREWPSAEHAMEWAYELVLGYRNGDARVRDLVSRTRTIVVPVVNVDGFNVSREAGELFQHAAGHATDADGDGEISDPEFILAGATNPNEYRRKNCRLLGDPPLGNCLAGVDTGLVGHGVDPNRNYGAFWGGAGSSGIAPTQTYRGPAPFSEPESQNVRELISARQVTTLITNHTFSNLVLRPPGIAAQGQTVDEPIYKALGDSMASKNGYASQFGYQLYDTDGTTEDWSYNATGGLGFTFEIGKLGFHPPFEEVVKEWNGTTAAANGGGGNREAYYLAQQNTADASKHSVLAGRAPANAILRLTKTFDMPTSVEGLTFSDTLNTTMQVGSDGRYEWHVNPSTRPLIAKGSSGREATGDPSPPQQFASNGPGSTVPCADFDNPPEGCYEDHLITVPSGAGIDNAKATFRIEFTPASDWDMKVYKADADGNATGDPVASSGNGATNGATAFEQATVLDPAGSYVVRVINWAAVDPWTGTVTFAGPDPAQAPEETWTLSCETPEGVTRSARQVFVARGERRSIDLRGDCRVRR
jgi:Zinc carboxypeptidase